MYRFLISKENKEDKRSKSKNTSQLLKTSAARDCATNLCDTQLIIQTQDQN